MNERTLRAFVALHPPANFRDGLERIQRHLKNSVRSGLVRWTPIDQIHLTLRFLGQTESESLPDLEAALRRACSRCAAFELSADALGCFPGERQPRVVWLGVKGAVESLRELQAGICGETKSWGEPEERPFHPHLTLARFKPGPKLPPLDKALQAGAIDEMGNWLVDEVTLMQSQISAEGAQHRQLASIRL